MEAEGNLYTCTDRGESNPTDVGYFIPIFVTDLVTPNQQFLFKEGTCFK
jgi:hypothetical protein